MERATKDAAIRDIKQRFDRATSAVFLDFQGMTVAQATKLRVELRKARVDYKVVKNTVVRHALEGAPYRDALEPVLRRMTAVAWSYDDPSAAAKVVKAFRKEEAGEKLAIKAGLVEGQVLDAKAVEEQLAEMPGKDELRAKLCATLQAPLASLVRLLSTPARSFVYVLSARKDAK